MNNQVFLVIAILFIVMIIVDFVFNFTGILKENFDVFSNEQKPLITINTVTVTVNSNSCNSSNSSNNSNNSQS